MSKTLEEIRKKLQAMDARKGGTTSFSNDKTTYAHWNIAEGAQATIRFIADGNEDNTFFWAERQLIKLPFAGIVGHDENKPVVVQVPCIEMWDGRNKCPILNEVRPMWKDDSLVETARKYWVKKTYYAQGFVKQDPMGETDLPENPIRKFIIGPQIYKIIHAALMDPELEYSPVDVINGLDFIVAKSSKGGFADYGTSKWARKETSLTEEQQAAIAKYGLVNLSDYLPKRPTPEQLAAMVEMFEASLDGELYDPARWGTFYKPFGFDSAPQDDGDGGEGKRVSRSPAPAPRPAPVVAQKPVVESYDDEVDAAEASFTAPASSTASVAAPGAAKSPQEILQMIRNRNKA